MSYSRSRIGGGRFRSYLDPEFKLVSCCDRVNPESTYLQELWADGMGQGVSISPVMLQFLLSIAAKKY